jgi:hypothetical protein
MHKFVCSTACTAFDPEFDKLRFFAEGQALVVNTEDAQAVSGHFSYEGEGKFVGDEFRIVSYGEDPRETARRKVDEAAKAEVKARAEAEAKAEAEAEAKAKAEAEGAKSSGEPDEEPGEPEGGTEGEQSEGGKAKKGRKPKADAEAAKE